MYIHDSQLTRYRSPSGGISFITYGRLSVKRKKRKGESEGLSIENQLSEGLRIGQAAGWVHAGSFRDDGRSGNGPTDKRTGWLAVCKHMLAHPKTILICTVPDRLFRDMYEWEGYDRRVLGASGGTIYSQMYGLYDRDDPFSRRNWKYAMVEAEGYVEICRWKSIESIKRRLREGKVPGTIPYGCIKGPEAGRPVKHPDEWPVLQEIYRLNSIGYSDQDIADELNRRNIPARSGNLWADSTIYGLLTKSFYRGVITVLGEEYEIQHDCMLPPEAYARLRVRAIRGGGRKNGGAHFLLPLVTCPHYLRGKGAMQLRPECGYGRAGKRNYTYYSRTDKSDGQVYKLSGIPRDALPAGIRADLLDAAVLDTLCSEPRIAEALSREVMPAITAALAGLKRDRGELASALSKASRSLTQVKRKLVASFDAKRPLATEVMEQEYAVRRDRVAKLTAELASFESQIASAEARLKLPQETAQRVHLLEELRRRDDRKGMAVLLETLIKRVEIIAVDGVFKPRIVVNASALLGALQSTIQEASPPGFEPGSAA